MDNKEAIKYLKWIRPIRPYSLDKIKVQESIDLAIKALEERPQGEWIMQRHDLDGCFYTCSNCGRMIRVSLFIDDPEDNETLADYPYCHCGASMKGGAK